MLSPDTTIQNRYRLIYAVDERPGGQVYRARDEQRGQLVLVSVLPVIDAASRAGLALLAHQVASLRQPLLLPIIEHFADPVGYCLISPDPGGQDLERALRARGTPLPEAEVLPQINRLLEALEQLHSHRPPLHIGHLWLTDLWIADDGNWRLLPATLVRPLLQGPSPYRAPELAAPEAEPTAATDTYAVSALLYHVLTGWAPPSPEQQAAGLVLTAPRALHSQLSALAEQALLRGLQQRASNRYQNARELRLALQTVQMMAGRSLGLGPDILDSRSQPQAMLPANLPAPPAAPLLSGSAYVGATQPIGPAVTPPPVGQPPAMAQPGVPAGAYPAQPPPQRGLNTGCLVALIIGLLMLVVAIGIGLIMLFYFFSVAGTRTDQGQGFATVIPAPASTAPALAQATSAPATSLPATSAPVATPTRPAIALPAGAITLQNVSQVTRTHEIVSDVANTALYSPDGRWLALGISDFISLRNTITLQEAERLERHNGRLIALAWSPDSRLLASGAIDDPVVRVWDVASGRLLRELTGHSAWIRTLAFSPDGTLLASGATDNTIRLWDTQSGELVRTLEGHSNWISTIVFSPDGQSLASTSRDGTLRLWEVASGQQRPEFSFQAPLDPTTNAPHWTTGLAFAPDGSQLALGAANGVVYLLDPASGAHIRELRGHTALILFRGVLFTPDGQQIITAGADRSIRVWNAADGAAVGQYEGHQLSLYSISISPDGQQLISTSYDEGLIYIWNTDDRSLASQLRFGQGLVTNLAYSSDSRVLGLAGFNGVLQLYQIDRSRGQLFEGSAGAPQPIAFLPDDRMVAITDQSALVLVTLGDRSIRELTGCNGQPLSVSASQDGGVIAAGTTRGQVCVWAGNTGQPRTALRTGLDRVYGTALNDDGSLLAVVGSPRDPLIELWDLDREQLLYTFDNPVDGVTGLAFQPGGERLAATDVAGSLWIWDVASGTLVQEQHAEQTALRFVGLGFSPDGALLATGASGDGSGQLVFWDAASGEQVAQIAIPQGGVLALAYSPDGRQVAISIQNDTNSVYIYEVPRR